MKRCLILGAMIVVVCSVLGAQNITPSVDRDEFTDIIARTINFINYNGAYAKIDTMDQILAIGRSLAQGIVKDKESTGSYGDRYYILHILGTPQEPGKPADILVLTEKSTVDHIDNIRRIISSYLQAEYGYGKADSDILAVFITVYNAVHRGNFTFFQGRYKSSVTAKLKADKVGLSIRYNEWPGKTQILIPLNLGAVVSNQPGSLSAVSAKDLVTPEVIETIRDKPDAGTKERQQLADLLDRTVDQNQNQIDQQKADLAKQQQAVDQKLAQLKQPGDPAATKVSAGNTPTASAPVTAAASSSAAATASTPAASADSAVTNAAALQAEKQLLETQQATLQDEQKRLDQEQAANNDLAKASQELRAGTAADLKNQGQESAIASNPVVAIRARLEKNLILGQAIKVIPATSEILGQSASSNLLGRRIYPFGTNLVAIEYDGVKGTMVLLTEQDLSFFKKGTETISPYSELVILPNGKECLAVMQQDGEWYVGKFDSLLNTVARSIIPVDPIGALVIKDTMILVQRKDGRITSLNLADLRAGN